MIPKCRIIGFRDRDMEWSGGLRDSAPGGKIHPVDPAAVANFKRILAEQEAAGRPRRSRPQPPKPRRKQLDADLARKRDELLARSRAAGNAKKKITNDKQETNMKRFDEQHIYSAHLDYVRQPTNMTVIAQLAGMSPNTLSKRFTALGLPARDRGGHFTAEETARICQVHDIQPHMVVGAPDESEHQLATAATVDLKEKPNRRPRATTAPEQNTPPAATETSAEKEAIDLPLVRPVQEPAETKNTELANKPADPDSISSQLALLQDLLAHAEAQSITVSGKLSLQLTAEINF